MCGFAGIFRPGGLERGTDGILKGMTDAIAHRGPDSDGHWQDDAAGIALGHRRLAIVELSAAGHQPMASASGRWMLIYNGEVYNHLALRDALAAEGKAPAWTGHSDTETILACVDAWGVRGMLDRLVGMFAFALWDRQDRRLWLARDRAGEKPLYYGWQGDSFLFGSELKTLHNHPAFAAGIDRQSLLSMLRHGNVGEDHSIFAGIHKVRPGEVLSLSSGEREITRETYWDGAAVACQPRQQITDAEAVDQLEALLLDAVDQQMMSDVPLGAFLSGGIDSSTIVALMQKLSDRPVHSFSIGFQEARYDEAGFARAVADHLGTRHTDLYVSEQDLLNVVPRLPQMYDEPFADSSQVPTFLVAKLAREHVTVALSGDGGDELFCGYDRYGHGQRLLQRLRSLPGPLRAGIAGAIRGVPAGTLTAMLERVVPTPQGKEPIGQRLHRLANFARQSNAEDLHRAMVSVWRFPEQAVAGVDPRPSLLSGACPDRGDLGVAERMMQLDMLTYLPDDILAKVDRATMAVSLESRAPLLDHRVMEFAWSLPEQMKLRDGVSKWALRQVLYRHVPRELIERPKMGFEVPIGLWLRGPLRDWSNALLDPARLAREGHLDPAVISKLWQQHQSGRFNWGAQLWCVLMFQAWLDDWKA